MRRAALIFLATAILLVLPNVVLSDCLMFGSLQRPVNWYALDDQTIVFYEGSSPIALVKMQNCTLGPSSTVRLIKRYLCDSDKIVIDNVPCSIMTITSASSGSF